jgi:hypothetical protein
MTPLATAPERSTVAKPKPEPGRQVNFRANDALYGRLERVAVALGLDISNLVRMVLHENLHVYEQRVEQIPHDADDAG